MEQTLPLAAEFDQAERADWQRLVAGVLTKTGALPEGFDGPPESLLTTTTYDGIEIQPLYTASDVADGEVPESGFPGLSPFVRGRRPDGNVGTGWDVRARHGHADVRAVNRELLADLEGGVTSVWLRVGRGGLPVDGLADALNEVRPDLAPVTLDAGADYVAAADALLEVHAEQGVPDAEVGGNLGADPVGLHARTGTAHDLAPAAELAPAPPPGIRSCGPSSPTDCRSTRQAARTRRSWAPRSPPASPTCGRSPPPDSTPTPPRRSWTSASPRPPTSSSRSPSSAPPAGCGPASPRCPA
ncbi:hypothetical protein BJF85_19700 [Saccharomonospora sp. CUA-673]|nr:hypothetical protein BJF85_19700 [Saccharomonospora sp. CUA-673]